VEKPPSVGLFYGVLWLFSPENFIDIFGVAILGNFICLILGVYFYIENLIVIFFI